MASLTGFRSAAPLPGCTSVSVGAGLDPLASVKGAKLEKLVALPEDAEDGRTPITLLSAVTDPLLKRRGVRQNSSNRKIRLVFLGE